MELIWQLAATRHCELRLTYPPAPLLRPPGEGAYGLTVAEKSSRERGLGMPHQHGLELGTPQDSPRHDPGPRASWGGLQHHTKRDTGLVAQKIDWLAGKCFTLVFIRHTLRSIPYICDPLN